MAEAKKYTIYELFSADESFPEKYIGRTHTELRHRLAKHKYDARVRDSGEGRNVSVSSVLFLKGLVAIRSIETDVDEADVANRERWHIENTPNTVNMRLAWATKKERDHAEYLRNIERKKQYAQDHAEELKANKKRHKDKVKNVLIRCEACQADIRTPTWWSHQKTNKHLKATAAAAAIAALS
jgi:hypothetical protein